MSKVIINTSPSPLWRRLLALFYDILLLMACIIVLGFVFIAINKG